MFSSPKVHHSIRNPNTTKFQFQFEVDFTPFPTRQSICVGSNEFIFPELRLAQLALDPNNSPGWDVLEQERSVSTKMPLYVKSHLVLQSPRRQTEVTCASSYTLLVQTPTRNHRPQTSV